MQINGACGGRCGYVEIVERTETMNINRSGEIGLRKFMLLHEPEIARSGKDGGDQWGLLWLAFFQMFNRKPGEKE
jgi:hypothetical protein